MARGEQPPERGLLAREALGERAAVRREARELGLRLAGLGLELAQRAVGFRDGALGVAQRVARLATARLLLVQPEPQRLEARAQRRQVLLAARVRRGCRGEREQDEERARQALAFPWAATAATRRATSAASPR